MLFCSYANTPPDKFKHKQFRVSFESAWRSGRAGLAFFHSLNQEVFKRLNVWLAFFSLVERSSLFILYFMIISCPKSNVMWISECHSSTLWCTAFLTVIMLLLSQDYDSEYKPKGSNLWHRDMYASVYYRFIVMRMINGRNNKEALYM